MFCISRSQYLVNSLTLKQICFLDKLISSLHMSMGLKHSQVEMVTFRELAF